MWIVASLIRAGWEVIYRASASHPILQLLARYWLNPTDATGCQSWTHSTKGPWTAETTCPYHRHVCAAEEEAAAPFRWHTNGRCMSRTGRGLFHPQSGTHARGRGPWHCDVLSKVQGNHHHHQQERGPGAPGLVGVETAITTRAVSGSSENVQRFSDSRPQCRHLTLIFFGSYCRRHKCAVLLWHLPESWDGFPGRRRALHEAATAWQI